MFVELTLQNTLLAFVFCIRECLETSDYKSSLLLNDRKILAIKRRGSVSHVKYEIEI